MVQNVINTVRLEFLGGLRVEMSENDAKESYEMAQKAHSMSKEQMKMMLERETGPSDRFSSSFG